MAGIYPSSDRPSCGLHGEPSPLCHCQTSPVPLWIYSRRFYDRLTASITCLESRRPGLLPAGEVRRCGFIPLPVSPSCHSHLTRRLRYAGLALIYIFVTLGLRHSPCHVSSTTAAAHTIQRRSPVSGVRNAIPSSTAASALRKRPRPAQSHQTLRFA